jgi:hypothetical protein
MAAHVSQRKLAVMPASEGVILVDNVFAEDAPSWKSDIGDGQAGPVRPQLPAAPRPHDESTRGAIGDLGLEGLSPLILRTVTETSLRRTAARGAGGIGRQMRTDEAQRQG